MLAFIPDNLFFLIFNLYFLVLSAKTHKNKFRAKTCKIQYLIINGYVTARNVCDKKWQKLII